MLKTWISTNSNVNNKISVNKQIFKAWWVRYDPRLNKCNKYEGSKYKPPA